jgi:DNA polymerase-3 subunit alpha
MGYAMLTDHGTCAGMLDFKAACDKVGIRPLLGTELYIKDDKYDNGKPKGWHMLLWALNDEGLHNIWAISSSIEFSKTGDHQLPNAHWSDLEGHGKGVVCSSACMASAWGRAAANDDVEMADYWTERCQGIFDRFAIELHTNQMASLKMEDGTTRSQRQLNIWLDKYAREHGIPTVYAIDSHYARKEDAEFQDSWLGMGIKAFYDEKHWTMDHEYYIQGEEEIRERLAYLGNESVERCFDGVDELVRESKPYTLDGTHKVPAYPIPEGYEDSDHYLRYLAMKGLLERVGGLDVTDAEPGKMVIRSGEDEMRRARKAIDSHIKQLVNVELPIVIDNGLADYFLMVRDYSVWSKKYSLVGPARGSGASSLLCYVLGITEVDPIGKGLIFERFLNQGRLGTYIINGREFGEAVKVVANGSVTDVSDLSIGDVITERIDWRGGRSPLCMTVESKEFRGGELPDIDLDFEPDFRPQVQKHIEDVYGADKVTAVGTIAFYSIKSALKDVCRYYRIPMPESNRLTSLVGSMEEMAGKGEPWQSQLENVPQDDRTFIDSMRTNFPRLFPTAERMLGLCRQAGKHAAGYVISPTSLVDSLPIRKVFHGKDSWEIVCQFDKYQVESLGYVKCDVLGLRNLATLRMAADFVEKRGGEKIDFYALRDDPSDMTTWSLFDNRDTLGIFQLESRGISDVAATIHPRSISDVSNVIALYRPGVIGAGMLDTALAVATGKERPKYLCPQLESILGDTFGVSLFQEQNMRIFVELGGFTEAESDRIRAAIGHKKIDQLMACKPQFISGCAARGISEQIAKQIFSWAEAAGSYQFNSSHSYAYAEIGFWTAYMKAHHPVEFYAASMSTTGDASSKYMKEARIKGIDIVPPILSKLSDSYTVIDDHSIAYGLVNVRGVGETSMRSILAGMPYEGFTDFVDRSGVNSRIIKSLINGGVFREIYPNARDLLRRYEANDYESNLFGDELSQEGRGTQPAVPYPPERIVELEQEIYGICLSVDPFDGYKRQLGPEVMSMCQGHDDLECMALLGKGVVLAKIDAVRPYKSKGGMMAFLGLTLDDGSQLEATMFCKMYMAMSDVVKVGEAFLMEVKKGQYNGRDSWTVENVKHLDGVM